MFLLSPYLRKLILFSSVIILLNNLRAQTSLDNIPAAFNAINTTPEVLAVKNNKIKVPSGGHLQGIEATSDTSLVVTGSSASYSYYLAARIHPITGSGQIEGINKIADKPLKHAGGCQVNGNTLLVGVENNSTKMQSDIMLIALNDMRITGQKKIGHREGAVKRSTAGAVGFTEFKGGKYLIAVGDWDSRNIDFYLYKTGSDKIDSFTTFSVPKDQKWCSYQSINLIKEKSTNVYLVAFGRDGSLNRADLYKLEFTFTTVSLKLVSSKVFDCKAGASFRYGAGIGVSDKQGLMIYSCGRKAQHQMAVNIFSSKQ